MKKYLLLAALCVLALTGCMRVTADELYSLPRMSEEYLQLQIQIAEVLNQGAVFSPPTSGPNRQAVQLWDLNGNGIDEVIAFFSTPYDGTLKIYIFEMIDGDFVVADIIEGIGTDIESIRYVDMDGDGMMELIVGWQMGAALKAMSIYSIRDFEHVLLASAEYSLISVFDSTGDGMNDVVALRLPGPDTSAVAEIFTLMPDGEIISNEARLSNGIEAISRVVAGRLSDGVPAMFVESEGRFDEYGGVGLVTDIVKNQDGNFINISLVRPSGISESTVRGSTPQVHSADMRRNGVITVPTPRRLRVQSETAYYAIDWYEYDSTGDRQFAQTTYHNTFDEWYLILPPDWRGRVSVRREDAIVGERTVTFSYITNYEETYEDFLKVHRLTGDRGLARASLPGRTVLMTEGTSMYVFELIAEPNSFGLTFDEALIRENFRLIYSDWLIGAMQVRGG